MGISAPTLTAIASIFSAVTGAAGTAMSVKRKHEQERQSKKTSEEAKKKEQLLKEKKLKSPGQRLLGGRPTLG